MKSEFNSDLTVSDEQDAIDLRTTCWHEAGHLVAAQHFDLGVHAEVIRHPRPPTIRERRYSGSTSYDRTTPFRECVIGWAGPLAELTAKEPESLCDLSDFYAFCDPSELSETDQAAIEGHPQQWRACCTAHRILTRNRATLEMHARLLETHVREAR
ncbi:MAG: hypothetical protein AB9869_02195 [Verrucomicrobiia bacterium]